MPTRFEGIRFYICTTDINSTAHALLKDWRCYPPLVTPRLFGTTGQVAIVTGGSRGIGRAIALALSDQGALVASLSRQATRQQNDIPDKLKNYDCDIRDWQKVQETFELIRFEMGAPSILINAAGVNHDGLLATAEVEDIKEIIDTNVLGSLYTSKAALRTMIPRREGHIINIGSVVGLQGHAGQSAYSSSKSAILGLTKSLAKEYAARNIRVNGIAPGFIDTEMTRSLSELQKATVLSKIPLGTFGYSEDIVQAVTFLLLSRYITGHMLSVDGGLVL